MPSNGKGILKADPTAKIISIPLADGGEGTVQSLVDATHGRIVQTKVLDPLGKEITAHYGFLGDQKTAVIEMAQASGLGLVAPDKRNPMNTSSYGTGQLILDALNHDVQQIIIGLGGSSTNDGGSGMMQALGVKLLDEKQQELPIASGGILNKLTQIDTSQLDKRLQQVKIIIASDVNNPLIGPNGASAVFGPQKGANEKMVKVLDQNLTHYAKILEEQLSIDVSSLPGSGAAGGLGAGLMAFTNCKIQKGVELAIKVTGLENKIQDAGYIFTGEGGTNFQTKFGKTPFGVAQLGKKYHKPVISLAGYLGKGIDTLYQEGFTAIFGILDSACDLKTALKNGPKNVERTTENIVRLLKSK